MKGVRDKSVKDRSEDSKGCDFQDVGWLYIFIVYFGL